jgi:subtilisin
VTRRFATVPYIAVELSADAVSGLRALPEAAGVAVDDTATVDLAESTPLIGAPRAITGGADGTGQTVAIVDTGVDGGHPFLASKVVSEACYSVLGDCPNGSRSQIGPGAAAPCRFDADCSHGTHVAGIAAGRRANGGTFDGVAPGATLIAINAFSQCPSGGPCAYHSDLLAALERVYALRTSFAIASVNMSLGGTPLGDTCDTDVLKPVIDNLAGAGIATVVASGNDYSSARLSSPACISSAISVGSTTDSTPVDRVSSFSNSAASLDLLAPGQYIRSSVAGGGYETWQGTSMAAPHVAGAWAVLKSRYPAWSVASVLVQLQSTGVAVTDFRNGLTKARILLSAPGRPGAPAAPAVVAGDRTVAVSWSSPDDNGGAVVTGYIVTVYAGAEPVRVLSAPGTSVTVTGLTNRVPHMFTVAATNSVGTGPASAGSAAVTPDAPADQPAPRSGYWMVGSDGTVHRFGDARSFGNAPTSSAVDLEPTPSGNGYWILDDLGRVFAFGDAATWGSVDRTRLSVGEKATSMSATPTGGGYWVFTNRGRVVTFGDAGFLGDVSTLALNGPVLDSIPTPSGHGYYMVAADGGIFAFGDARFSGSMGGVTLNAPVQSLVPDAGSTGYWLVASDGGIFAFGPAFKGSMGGRRLNRPITGMVRCGPGYLMVGEDGGVFDFSGTSNGFKGSLAGTPLTNPIVSVAVLSV